LKAPASFYWQFSSPQPVDTNRFGIFLGFSVFPVVLSIFDGQDFSHTPVFGGPQFV
jgi:hypothetical protein